MNDVGRPTLQQCLAESYGNNPIEADHGRLKSRLRAMRGLKQLRCARVITAGHAFIQNIRRGHYELGAEETETYGSWLPSTSSSWRSDQPR
jgi:transposase-like protein